MHRHAGSALFLDKIPKLLTSHAFLPATVANLSTLKYPC